MEVVYEPPLDVWIDGPTNLLELQFGCTWTADTSGGAGTPTNYEWKRDGVVVSTSPTYTGPSGTDHFTLEVTVWDSSHSAYDGIMVGVNEFVGMQC